MDKPETTPSTSPVNDQTTVNTANYDHLVSPAEVGSQPIANDNPVVVRKEPSNGEFKQNSPEQMPKSDIIDKPVNPQQVNNQSGINFDTYTSNPIKNESKPESMNNNDKDFDQKSSRVGTIITIILIAIIVIGIWQTNKDNNGEVGSDNNELAVTVDDSEETGTVTIIDGADTTKVTDPKIDGPTVKIMAFYNKSGDECENVTQLERTVEKKYDSDVINTVRGLITPLFATEVAAGWQSSIPAGVYLRNVAIKDGVAKVTFNSALNNVAGSCKVLAIRSQIEKTLLQFSYVDYVEICIDNNCNQAEILQP